MTKERYRELMSNPYEKRTTEEKMLGWHFCHGWDELLIGPGMSEIEIRACDICKELDDKQKKENYAQ